MCYLTITNNDDREPLIRVKQISGLSDNDERLKWQSSKQIFKRNKHIPDAYGMFCSSHQVQTPLQVPIQQNLHHFPI